MKVIVIKDKPNIHLNGFINEINKLYSGIVTKLVYTTSNNLNPFHLHIDTNIFNNILHKLNYKKSKELVFIYINDEDKIKKLIDNYNTIIINNDIVFEIIKDNDVKITANNFIKKYELF